MAFSRCALYGALEPDGVVRAVGGLGGVVAGGVSFNFRTWHVELKSGNWWTRCKLSGGRDEKRLAILQVFGSCGEDAI